MPNSTELYIGLMSGTSMDALDCAVVQFSSQNKSHGNRPGHQPLSILGTIGLPLPSDLRTKMLRLCEGGYSNAEHAGELLSWAELDCQFAKLSATAVNQLLAQLSINPNQIKAIGSHGQTIRHFPEHTYPHSLQLGDPNLIAELTGITTVADFRRRDVASGGQGAPLVPAFHQDLFRSPPTDRIVLNIGGISNITLLTADSTIPTSGYDTGPGNTLMDSWVKLHKGLEFDESGKWAAAGQVNTALLDQLLSDAYFQRAAPKSTGRELFNLDWLNSYLGSSSQIKPVDVQATLLELTSQSIALEIERSLTTGEILVCGGGALNPVLLESLRTALGNFNITTTSVAGLDPLWVEAAAFAWLAKQTIDGLSGNLPEVTGASGPRILGGIYQA